MRRRQPKYVATLNLSIWQPESAVLISLCMYSKTTRRGAGNLDEIRALRATLPDEAPGICMEIRPLRTPGFLYTCNRAHIANLNEPNQRRGASGSKGGKRGPATGWPEEKDAQWRFARALLYRARERLPAIRFEALSHMPGVGHLNHTSGVYHKPPFGPSF